MDYHYQWPMSMGSTLPETKKWDESFWGKSPRCLGNPGDIRRCFPRTRSARRRRFCPPPSNHYPRPTRPQWTPAFHNYDYKWNQGGSEKPPRQCPPSPYDYDHDYYNMEFASKNRSCPKKAKSKKTGKSEQHGADNVDVDYFPIKSPQINGLEYLYHGDRYGGPPMNEHAQSGSEFYDYSQLGLVTDIEVSYSSPDQQAMEYRQDCSRALMSPVAVEGTLNVFQPGLEAHEKAASYLNGSYLTPPEDDENSNCIEKETAEEPHGETSDSSVPIDLNGSQCYEILRSDPILGNLQEETELAIQNLEMLYPPTAFTAEQQMSHPPGSVTVPSEDPAKAVEAPIVQSCVEETAQTLVEQNQPSSTTHNTENGVPSESGVGGQSTDSSGASSFNIVPSMPSEQFVTEESIVSLVQQNQLLADFISQMMSGQFEFEKDFFEEGQMTNGTEPEALQSLTDPSNCQIENLNQETVPFKDPNLNETAVERNEKLNNDEPLTSISDIYDCDLLSFDLDKELSCLDALASIDQLNSAETTCTSYSVDEPDRDLLGLKQMKSMFLTDTEEEMLSLCVAPNSVLKEQKRTRRRLKKGSTNGQVKTKKVRRGNGLSSKPGSQDEEQTALKACETNFCSNSDSKPLTKNLCDAQTQASDFEVALKERVDAGTQWTYDDVKGNSELDHCETLKSAEEVADSEKEQVTRLISSCEVNTGMKPQEYPPSTSNCLSEVQIDDSSLSGKNSIDVKMSDLCLDEEIALQDCNTPWKLFVEKSVNCPVDRDSSKKMDTYTDNSTPNHHPIKDSLKLDDSVQDNHKTVAKDDRDTLSGTLLQVEERDLRNLDARDRPKKQVSDTDNNKTMDLRAQDVSVTKGHVQKNENSIDQDSSIEIIEDENSISEHSDRCRWKRQADIDNSKTKHEIIQGENKVANNEVPKNENGETDKHDSSSELRLSTRSWIRNNNPDANKSPVPRVKKTGQSRRQAKGDYENQDTPILSRQQISTRFREKKASKETSTVSNISLRRKRPSSPVPNDPPCKKQRLQSSSSEINTSEKLDLKSSDNGSDYLTPKPVRILRKHVLRNTTI